MYVCVNIYIYICRCICIYIYIYFFDPLAPTRCCWVHLPLKSDALSPGAPPAQTKCTYNCGVGGPRAAIMGGLGNDWMACALRAAAGGCACGQGGRASLGRRHSADPAEQFKSDALSPGAPPTRTKCKYHSGEGSPGCHRGWHGGCPWCVLARRWPWRCANSGGRSRAGRGTGTEQTQC